MHARGNTTHTRWRKDESGDSSGIWTASSLGKATVAAGLTPEMALQVKSDLETARLGLCLADDLHLTFLVTPLTELLELSQHQWAM